MVRTTEEKVELLEYENSELKSALGQNKRAAVMLKVAYGIKPKEASVLSALLERDFMTKDGIYSMLYSAVLNPPEFQIIDVFICQIRKAIAPAKIETVWGLGVRISKGDKQIIRDKMDSAFS